MSHYEFCSQNIGRPVKIVTRHGEIHRGVIQHVNRSRVFLSSPGLGGYGQGYYGYGGYGFGGGLGLGIALGAIASIAFLPFFFW